MNIRYNIGISFIAIDNPLFTNTRYDDKIHYNDNLTVTKVSLNK